MSKSWTYDSTMSADIRLPYLQRNKRKYVEQTAKQRGELSASPGASLEQPPGRNLVTLLRIISKRGKNKSIFTTDEMLCPICQKKKLRTVDVVLAHLRVAHSTFKSSAKELPQNPDGVVGEVYIDFDASRKTHVQSSPARDALAPGEDRFFFRGRPWRKRRRVECGPASPSEASSETTTKRLRFASSSNETPSIRVTQLAKASSFLLETKHTPTSSSRVTAAANGEESEFNIRSVRTSPRWQGWTGNNTERSNEQSKAVTHDLNSAKQAERPESPKGVRSNLILSSNNVSMKRIARKPSLELLQCMEELDRHVRVRPERQNRVAQLQRYLNLSLEVRKWAKELDTKVLELVKREIEPFTADHEPASSTEQCDAGDLEQLRAIQERFWSAVDSNYAAGEIIDEWKSHGHPDTLLDRITGNTHQEIVSVQEQDLMLSEPQDSQDAGEANLPPTARGPFLETDPASFGGPKSKFARLSSAHRSAGDGDEPGRSSSIENVNPRNEESNRRMVLRSNRPSLEQLSPESLSRLSANRRETMSQILKRTELTTTAQPIPESPETQISISNKSAHQPTITPLPTRPRTKYKVPPPPAGVTFFTSITKRPLDPGEELSESDNDEDDEHNQAWLTLKQDQLIDRLPGVTPAAKEFLKVWNAHFRRERVPGDRFFGDAFMRFVAAHGGFLRRRDIWPEFRRKQAELVAEGLIGQSQVTRSNEMAKAWSRTRAQSNVLDATEWSMRCSCGKDVVDFRDAVTCCGEACINPDYHLGCVGLKSRLDFWLCPTCKRSKEA